MSETGYISLACQQVHLFEYAFFIFLICMKIYYVKNIHDRKEKWTKLTNMYMMCSYDLVEQLASGVVPTRQHRNMVIRIGKGSQGVYYHFRSRWLPFQIKSVITLYYVTIRHDKNTVPATPVSSKCARLRRNTSNTEVWFISN